jgi:hypothetical protein
MTDTKDERIAELEDRLHYANGCCDLAMKHRDEAERRADALERQRSLLDRSVRECHDQLHALVTTFVPDNDAAYQQTLDVMRWARDAICPLAPPEEARAFIDQQEPDQLAENGSLDANQGAHRHVSGKVSSADQSADASEPEHRATLAVVPDGYYGWNVTEDSRIVSGPHRSQADAVEAMRARARRTPGDTP